MAIAIPGARVALYAPTGFLGRRVLRELLSRGAAVRLAGRNPRRLAALAEASGPSTEWIEARIDDAAALQTWLSGCTVLVNAAGALAGIGEALIARAIAARVHYIDAAGEQPYIRRVFEAHGRAAERAGVALVPAMGFDYALGDALTSLVARGLQPAREVVVAYAIQGAEVGANSLRFAAQTPLGPEVFYESGTWKPARVRVYRRTLTFPHPFGRQLMARYGAGEIVTVPRHVETDEVTALISVAALVPDPRFIPFFPYLRPLVTLARRTPLRHLLSLAASLRSSEETPASAQDAAPQSSRRFAILAEVSSQRGERRRGIIEGRDFHRVTARTLAFGASRLAAADFAGRGALAPAMAVTPEALFAELSDLEVTWRVEP
jgi:short subunit dehydrogenase-like uncharacterized protein